MDALLTIDCGNVSRDHVFCSKLSFLLSMMPVTSLNTLTTDGLVLRDYTFGVSKLHLTPDVSKIQSHSQHHSV